MNKARELEDESLAEAILALEALGNTAGVRDEEYKNLLNKVNTLIAKGDEVVENKKVVEINKPKTLNYAGVKMIGFLYYSSKDKYATGFATADECAQHFNGE